MKQFIFPLAVSLSVLSSCGAQQHHVSSGLDSVDIPQTAVKDQMKTGFCWSYALNGLVESVYKNKTGKDVDLSEEALAFYNISEQLFNMSNIYFTNDSVSPKQIGDFLANKGLEAWVLMLPDDSPLLDGMELLEKYGAVPENEWSVKFKNRKALEKIIQQIREDFVEALKNSERDTPLTLEDIQEILVGKKKFKSAPPKNFRFRGKKVEASNFIKNQLGFDVNKFTFVTAKNSRSYDEMIELTKKALAKGYSVPMGYPVNSMLFTQDKSMFSYQDMDHSDYDNISAKQAFRFFGKNGGHAVLVTDFVNEGGQEGAISAKELREEVKRPSSELDYLKFKNSWGKSASSNESGVEFDGADDGYYRIDKGYLKGSADSTLLTFVLPKDIVF